MSNGQDAVERGMFKEKDESDFGSKKVSGKQPKCTHKDSGSCDKMCGYTSFSLSRSTSMDEETISPPSSSQNSQNYPQNGTTTISHEIMKLNQAYERIQHPHNFKINDMVYTRGVPNLAHNWLHCIIIGPIKDGMYPVHTILRDGTSCILHFKPEYLILSSSAQN